MGSPAVAAALPPVRQAACSSGWDQLLSDSERQQQEAARGCAAQPHTSAAIAAQDQDSLLAGQMSAYTRAVTQGPMGPLASPLAVPGKKGAGQGTVAARLPAGPQAPRRAAGRSGATGGVRPVMLAPLIDQAARAYDIDPLLLHAIARVESRHNIGAISHAGAHGLMQVIVPTARRFGVGQAAELHDPATNLDVSARYLKTLQQRFGNNLPLVLAAYNAGEGAVEKHGRQIPPYRETQSYVRKVLAEYGVLRQVSLRSAAPGTARANGKGAL